MERDLSCPPPATLADDLAAAPPTPVGSPHAAWRHWVFIPRFRETRHFADRCRTRGMDASVLEFVLTYGVEFDGADAHAYTVITRSLPHALRDTDLARRSLGWILVVSEGGALLSCYRRKNAAHFLKVKSDHNDRRRPRRHARTRRDGEDGSAARLSRRDVR